MKRIIHIEDGFLTKEECQHFIEYYVKHKSSIEYYNVNSTFTLNILSIYKKDKILSDVVDRVSNICKSFDSDIVLDTLQIVRWPIASSMKPHFDPSNDVFAAMVYLNDDFSGGHTCFDHLEVKPEVGKMIIFSNSQYRHYVTNVNSGIRHTLAFWFVVNK